MTMKDEIQRFKERNGNVDYTVKELLYSVNQKLDDMHEKVIANTVWRKVYFCSFIIIFTTLGYIIFV